MNLEQWLATGQRPSTYFCRNRKTPLLMEGVMTALTRQLYLDPSVLYPGVREYDPTNKCDKSVYIEGSNIWSDGNVDRRPAIIVDIGSMEFKPVQNAGMDKRLGFDLEEGVSYYERVVIGSIVWAHLGKNKGVVSAYASNTYDLIDAFSHAIKKDYCFDIFEARSILKPRLRKAEPEDWECLFQIDYQLKEGYSVKTESTKLKTISLEAVVSNTHTQDI